MSEPAQLGLRSVSFAYGSVTVLHDVTMAVHRGEMVAIVGPNGGGKTTALRLLSGDLRPGSGDVLIDGKSVRGLSPVRRAQDIAVVPQHVDPSLAFPVRVLVSMGRSPHTGFLGITRDSDQTAIDKALEQTESEALAGRRFDELSGGERQRVALAMALAQESSYLLLDEPTVHLDLHHQYTLLELIRRLRNDRGIGVVAVLHDLNLAALYFDTVVLLAGGRVQLAGPPNEVLTSRPLEERFRVPLDVITHPSVPVPQVLLRPDAGAD